MSSAEKLRKYKQAYEKCLKNCSLEKKNDGGKKSCQSVCASKFLKFDFCFDSENKKRSPSKKKKRRRRSDNGKSKRKSKRKSKSLSKYQTFVKKNYNKFRSLDNKDRLKQIAKLWNQQKKN